MRSIVRMGCVWGMLVGAIGLGGCEDGSRSAGELDASASNTSASGGGTSGSGGAGATGDTGGTDGTGANGGAPCTPGDSWKDDCNTCSCDADGNASCTEIGCAGTGTGGMSTGSSSSSSGDGGGKSGDAGANGDGGSVPDAAIPTLCSEPQVVGPCDAAFPAFWHNPATGECESFTYGGCGGNDNNFETLQECESTCEGAKPADGCAACLAGGGTWQPEIDACTQSCAVPDLSCFTKSCPGSCEDDCGSCFSSAECQAAGCTWHSEAEAMWCAG